MQNKDVFMRYHKVHLTRRLILDTSADNEKEENMVEWLRVSECLHLSSGMFISDLYYNLLLHLHHKFGILDFTIKFYTNCFSAV